MFVELWCFALLFGKSLAGRDILLQINLVLSNSIIVYLLQILLSTFQKCYYAFMYLQEKEV